MCSRNDDPSQIDITISRAQIDLHNKMMNEIILMCDKCGRTITEKEKATTMFTYKEGTCDHYYVAPKPEMLPSPQQLWMEKISTVFDDLTTETYYGINFRSVLYQADADFLTKLESFLEKCKAERLALGQEWEKVDSAGRPIYMHEDNISECMLPENMRDM